MEQQQKQKKKIVEQDQVREVSNDEFEKLSSDRHGHRLIQLSEDTFRKLDRMDG